MSRSLIDLCLGQRSAPSRTLSRRQLLQVGLAAGAGLLSGRSLVASSHLARPRILVIGAGFSGLACAYELTQAGYETKVLEARGRVGGRVISLKDLIPGKIVEGGAEMLGSNHPHALAYAARFGLKFRDVIRDEAPSPVVLNGNRLTNDDVARISKEVSVALTRMTDDARSVVADEPWKTPDAVRLDQTSTGDWIGRQEISALAKALLAAQLTATNGVAVARQSYLGNLSQVRGGGLEKYWTDTEVYRLQGGNQQYAERFAAELGQDRIHLNCPVKEITINDGGVVVIDKEGQKHQADEVVLAVPPSVWPQIQFTPGLPEALKPQMGFNVKFLAVVKEPIWRRLGLSSNAVTDLDLAQTWEGTDGQGEAGPMALVAFSGGPAAEANHRRAVAERQPTYLRMLESLYPGFSAQFIKGRFMDWIGDSWTKGGYSFPAPGQVTTMGPALRAGLGRLHFAGEHTCYQFVGYMEGALRAGASLAKRLALRDGVITRP